MKKIGQEPKFLASKIASKAPPAETGVAVGRAAGTGAALGVGASETWTAGFAEARGAAVAVGERGVAGTGAASGTGGASVGGLGPMLKSLEERWCADRNPVDVCLATWYGLQGAPSAVPEWCKAPLVEALGRVIELYLGRDKRGWQRERDAAGLLFRALGFVDGARRKNAFKRAADRDADIDLEINRRAGLLPKGGDRSRFRHAKTGREKGFK